MGRGDGAGVTREGRARVAREGEGSTPWNEELEGARAAAQLDKALDTTDQVPRRAEGVAKGLALLGQLPAEAPPDAAHGVHHCFALRTGNGDLSNRARILRKPQQRRPPPVLGTGKLKKILKTRDRFCFWRMFLVFPIRKNSSNFPPRPYPMPGGPEGPTDAA